MKAIQTSYNGYLFRSRLEARWAVFFDELGIDYRYEDEGYELEDGTWYLPDFWLPKHQIWIEIKPIAPTEQEKMKATLLTETTKRNTYIFYGDIVLPEYAPYEEKRPYADGFLAVMPDFVANPDFISETFKGLYDFLDAKGYNVAPYDGTAESAYKLIEMDRLFYWDRYKKRHAKWGYGIYFAEHFCWVESTDGRLGVCYLPGAGMFSASRTIRLIKAYKAARSARFER